MVWRAVMAGGRARLCVLAMAAAMLAAPSASAEMVLHIGNSSDPETLDPHKVVTANGATIVRDLCEGLVAPDPADRVTAGLAERWEVSPDGKTWTFHLREGLKWSDGTPFTAGEYVWSMRRAVDPKTLPGVPDFFYAIRNAREITAGAMPPESLGVSAPDDRTVVFELWRPFPDFLHFAVAGWPLKPVQRAAVEAHGDAFTRPGNFHCTGAFILAESVPQSHVKLVRNPHYWDAANVKADVVYYHATPDLDSELRRFRAGELHMTYTVPATQMDWLRRNMADRLVTVQGAGTYHYLPNFRNPPWAPDNAKLRRALAMVIDRAALVTHITRGGEVPAYTVVPPLDGYAPPRPDWADWPMERRITEARRLYAEAGYGPGNPLRLEIMYNTQDRHRQIAVGVAAMWKQTLGVETTLNNLEWKVLVERMASRSFPDLIRRTIINGFAFRHLDIFRSEATSGLGAGWSEAEFDQLMAESETIADPAAYLDTLRKAEAHLLESMPLIPILHESLRRLVDPRLRGFVPNSTLTHRARYLWLEE